MIVRPGESIEFEFETHHPDTGATTAADSLPSGVVVVDGDDTAEVVTITGKGGGKYKAATAVPSDADPPGTVEVRIAATVNAIAGIDIVFRARLEVAEAMGSVEFTYTVTRSDNAQPIASVEVTVTTDEGGDNAVAQGTTDAFGAVVFNLDPGEYFFWRRKPGFTFADPDEETVS